MKKVELHDGTSLDNVQENIQHLKTLFPEVFDENGVNFDTLRQLLGDQKVLSEGEEKYGLNWHGKKQARQIALTPSLGTLRPCSQEQESVAWDTTQNIFIEGDNLEVLKLLQKSYAGKIKMIYIDPPYNTGNDFVYEDDFKDTLDTYLRYTGQKDSDGKNTNSNKESSGRKHTNWLNMIYPRLKLAKNLLSDDGVIFISIDDNEQANLKKVCDEIFGEENFVDIFSWQKTTTPPNLGKKTKKSCEYIVCYQKLNCKELIGIIKNSNSSNGLLNQTNSIKELVFPAFLTFTKLPNGTYTKGIYGTKSYEITLLEDTVVKDGCFITPVHLKGKFKWSQEYLEDSIKNGVKVYIQTKAFSPSYEKSEYSPEKPWNIINSSFGVGTNENASDELDELFNKNFSEKLYPKPTSLLEYLINTNVKAAPDSLILDFFAGSGTTAHAVMKLNAEDGGNRRFICVQIPEPTSETSEAFKAGYKTIAAISKERIRRAGATIKADNPMFTGDTGFKVFKLDTSNIKVWNPDRADLEQSLLDYQNHLLTGRTEQDILYELLLKRGVDLTTPIETKQIAGKNVYSIGYGKIIACLDDVITNHDTEALAAGIINWQKELKQIFDGEILETYVFFKDSAFDDDIAKTNIVAILSQFGIHHVRSL